MSEIKNDFIIDKTFKPKPGNGRIQLNANENGTPFFIQDLIPKNEKTNYSNATQYMFNPTLLSSVFFSLDNIEILQNALRAQVYNKTNKKYIIDKQNYDQLKIIMRGIYLQHALHKDDHIKEQVETLNKLVLDYCVPQLYSELMSYMKYKEDITTLPVPLKNPVYYASDKTIELNRFF